MPKTKVGVKIHENHFLSIGEVLSWQSARCSLEDVLFEVLWNLCLKMNLGVGACGHNPSEGMLKTSGFLSLGGQSA